MIGFCAMLIIGAIVIPASLVIVDVLHRISHSITIAALGCGWQSALVGLVDDSHIEAW